jgi:hypothetical protein
MDYIFLLILNLKKSSIKVIKYIKRNLMKVSIDWLTFKIVTLNITGDFNKHRNLTWFMILLKHKNIK